MTGPAREVTRGGMIRAGQRPVGHSVTVDVAISRPFAGKALEVRFGQNLSAVKRPVGVLELGRHPEVHAEVEVRKYEHRRLEPVGVVEGVAGELVALLDRS